MTHSLDEGAAKEKLSAYGLDVPCRATATGVDAAAEAAISLLPVALKARGVAHKTDIGGVALGLTTKTAVLEAATQMGCDDFYIEEMIADPIAELLVAILADPAHGYVLTLGAGGVMTELWQDTTHVLVPATDQDIRSALERLRIAPLLRGYRGKPAASIDAVVAAVMAIQNYVLGADGRVAEIEINPLLVTPTRAVAADALIREEP
jgi:succinyl-CoA synthetase beta subunit